VDAPGLRVRQVEDLTSGDVNQDGVYWTVQTPDGTTYRLGYFEAVETGQDIDWGEITLDGVQHDGRLNDYSGLRWRVDTVTDIYGNQIQYDYTEWTEPRETYFEGTFLTTSRARLTEIRYNYANRAANASTRVGGSFATKIRFISSGKRVDAIELYHRDLTTPYQIIDIGLGVAGHNNLACAHGEWDSRTQLIHYIRIKSGDGLWQLPDTKFTYVTKPHGTRGEDCWEFEYLETVDNGYGGRLKFTYDNDNRASYGGDNVPEYGQSYFVTQQEAWDGVPSNPARTTYDYDFPCYDQVNAALGDLPGSTECYTGVLLPGYPDPRGNLVGFAQTTVTRHGYDQTVLNRQVHSFWRGTDQGDDYQFLRGRPKWVDLKDGNGVLLHKQVYTYLRDAGSGYDFTYTGRQCRTLYAPGEESQHCTDYYYDQSRQGGRQWGKVTGRNSFHYDSLGDTVLEKREISWYRTSTNNWVIVPWITGTYAPDWTPQAVTLHLYDNNTNNPDIQTIDKGQLTLQRALLVDAPNTVSGNTIYKSADATYTYDSYGNRITTKTYSGYGEVGNDGTYWNHSIMPDPDTAAVTAVSYESDYHLYPVAITNALGQVTGYKFYGFNGVAVDGFQRQAGLLKQVTDPNGIATRYEYDPFGRLYAVYDGFDNFAGFGDSDEKNGDPVVRYRYWDNGWNASDMWLDPAEEGPFLISSLKRPGTWPNPPNSNLGSGFGYATQTFYDGFGRPIQERSIWHEVQGQSKRREIYTITEYDALGRESCRSAPFDVAYYNDRPGVTWPDTPWLSDACTAHSPTTTTYDALGRPDRVTAPDGTTTNYNFYINNNITVGGFNKLRVDQVIDANGHVINRLYNPRGQMVQVREYTGTGSGSDPYVHYASTTYTYDLQDNLKKVVDADNNTTTMDYDALGRKVGMTDPDMGTWTYEYDAAGNLLQQKDARGQQLCFYYDKLDRMMARVQDSSPNNDCPATNGVTSGNYHLATYVYDQATYGKGQPYTVSWGPNPGQNFDRFYYDSLGRMTRQERTLDGRLYAMETLSFDALNRPLQIRYPSGEVVTKTYDREGEDSLKAGNELLVNDVRYNERSQMTFLDRVHEGSTNIDARYLYYGASGSNGNSNFRLQEIRHGSTSDNRPDFSYSYDRVGNVSGITAVTYDGGTDQQSFTYDHLNRLQTAGASGGVADYSYTYQYDKIGNIKGRSGSGGTLTYNYGSQPHAVSSISNGQSFAYDANGNMTTRDDESGDYTQVFDVENRLAQVVDNDSGATTLFQYDADGQ
jgi:YD repeat-containing protein